MRIHRAVALIGSTVFPLLLVNGCGPPSIGDDREVFQAVDALYTAVSLRDPSLVGRCDDRLKQLNDTGKLPSAASTSLAAIAAEAQADRWESAQDHLSRFIEGQRR